MALTPENRESTSKSYHPAATWRDLAKMDGWQLNRYCRGIFTDDEAFDDVLPMTRYIYFNPDCFRDPMHDRAAPGPGSWLAGVHNIIGPIYREVFTIDGAHPDFGYRERFRSVIVGIFDDLDKITRPIKTDIKIAKGAIDAVMEMHWENEVREDQKETAPQLPESTLAMFAEDQLSLDLVKPIMWGYVKKLYEDKRWGIKFVDEWDVRKLKAFTTT